MPYLFLDNITALTDIDENRAQDWKPIMHWLIRLKNKGIANAFVHHAGKTTGTSSGSNAKERLIDLSIRIEKLDSKHRFQNMGGAKNVQCSLSFDKARNFGGSSFYTEFILTCDEEGKWKKYPMLDQNDFTIIEGHKKGLSPKDMKEEFEDLLSKGLHASPIHEVLIDKAVLGWKEYELELLRDDNDNVIIICNIENLDPMGIHTGD